MPLPFKVDSIDAVEEAQRPLYQEKDGAFFLDVEGIPETKEVVPNDYEALQTSVQKLEANNKALMKEKAEKSKQAEQARLEAAKAGGDIEAVEKSWKEKCKKIQDESAGTSSEYQTIIGDLTVGKEASAMANEITIPGSAKVVERHIRDRLSVEIVDGKPNVRVLDKDGRPSAMTLKELSEEFKNMDAFAPIIVGSKASGGGGSTSSGGDAKVPKMSIDKFNMLTPTEQADFAKNKGEII